jgi:hypothetical protein
VTYSLALGRTFRNNLCFGVDEYGTDTLEFFLAEKVLAVMVVEDTKAWSG